MVKKYYNVDMFYIKRGAEFATAYVYVQHHLVICFLVMNPISILSRFITGHCIVFKSLANQIAFNFFLFENVMFLHPGRFNLSPAG